MSYCLISFGSNLGDRQSLLQSAARRIVAHPGIASLRASRIFTTPPVGGPSGQQTFYNAAAVIETCLNTDGVLQCLQSVEQELGRVRATRWDQRLIDLDVVLYGDFVGQTWRLNLPHPRYTARAFVLTPAVDVAADWQDPRFGWSLQQLREHLHCAAPSIALVGGSASMRHLLGEQLHKLHRITHRTRQGSVPEMALLGHAPGEVSAASAGGLAKPSAAALVDFQKPWVSDFVPEGVFRRDRWQASRDVTMPRLIARLTTQADGGTWPSPQVIYRNRWNWPEYSLEIDDPQWAVGELAAAIQSMHCDVQPVTDDGTWATA